MLEACLLVYIFPHLPLHRLSFPLFATDDDTKSDDDEARDDEEPGVPARRKAEKRQSGDKRACEHDEGVECHKDK